MEKINKDTIKFGIIAAVSSLVTTIGGIIGGIATSKAVAAATQPAIPEQNLDIPAVPTSNDGK